MSILRSSTYSLGTKAIETILNLILLAILARLLEPKDFGIFAIVLAVQALLQPLVDMGLTPAYVKAKNPTQELQNSFFTLNLALGVFNMLILLILAPIVSVIYEDEVLMYLIAIFSFSVVLSSIIRQPEAHLVRNKRFDILMKISILANLITFIVSVYFAYEDYGVWVLVIKSIAFNISMAILIYYYTKQNYTLRSWNKIKQFTIELKFGLQIFINRVLNGIFNASDKFIFGKLFGIELLGHYSNAQQIARMADTHIRMPITSAIYSYLERYSDSDKKNFYDKFASIVFLITSFFSTILILEGDILLIYFLGDKWTFASEYIQPFGLFAMGMVFKGISTIIAMSENNMIEQNKKVLTSFFIFLLIVSLVYTLGLSIYFFVVCLSFSLYVYWLIILIKEIYRYNKKVIEFIKMLIFVSLLVLTLFYCKQFLQVDIIRLIVVSCIDLGILLSLLFSQYRKIIQGSVIK